MMSTLRRTLEGVKKLRHHHNSHAHALAGGKTRNPRTTIPIIEKSPIVRANSHLSDSARMGLSGGCIPATVVQITMENGLAKGIQLFNAGRYFEAHEALEAEWLIATGQRKTFLHGLIQVAAAFHHHIRHNSRGFHSLLGKGCAKLKTLDPEVDSVDVANLMSQLQSWAKFLPPGSQRTSPLPALPKIRLVNKS